MSWWDDYTNTEKAGLGSGAASAIGGFFGGSGNPGQSAGNAYQKYAQQGVNAQNPFLQAGTNAIPQYQAWLQGQSDPSTWINNQMNNYQQSPWAKYSQQQGMRAGENAASASGMMGSTPFMQQMQQNSQNISSADMQNWLANVMGINTQYGAGQQNMMQGGQGAANALSQMYGNMGDYMGGSAYNQQAGNQNDMWNQIGGLASIASIL